MIMKIYLGADHRGFKLKESLKSWLIQQNHQVVDHGNKVLDSSDDYVDYALQVAQSVTENNSARGIVICGSGAGVTFATNKMKGVRATLGFKTQQVKDSREDDDINILALAADYSNREEAQQMVKAFLETDFKAEERHLRRLDKVSKINL